MRGITRCLILLAIAPLIDVAVAFGQSAGESDSSKTGRAADIVKQIISNEAKVDNLDSLYLRLLGKWIVTPEGIAARREDLKKQHPTAVLDQEKYPELRPTMVEELEIALDDIHQRKLQNWHGRYYKLQVWDGTKTTTYERPDEKTTECYGFSNDPPGSQTLFGDLNGFRFNERLLRSEHRAGNTKSSFDLGGLPEDYQFAGEQDYRGRRCTVLENRARRQRLFVGTRDRRLYGLLQLGGPNHADEMALFRRVTGEAFETDDVAKQWYARQEPAKIEELRAKMSEMEYDVSQPFADYFLDDYRELAPGFWFAARQGYTSYRSNGDKPNFAEFTRELWLVEAKVNEPLDENLFKIEMEDGIEVCDATQDPPLIYKQKADRTREEWQAIIDEAKSRRQQENPNHRNM